MNRLYLTDCCLTDAGATAIGQALSKNSSLKELRLSDVFSTIILIRIKLETLEQWD